MRYILGIDIGTTAIKGAVIGEDGKIYGTKTSEYPLTTLPTGEVEADLQLYINAFTQSIKGAVEDAKVDVADIKCVGFSSTAETCVFLDKYNEPLCKVIAWMDTRATKEAEYLTAHFDKKDIINGEKIVEGDVIIGLPSSGVHSNGYSLVRKVFEPIEECAKEYVEELGQTVGEALLTPTKIYVKEILSLMKKAEIKGISNITGGGFIENIPRCLPKGRGLCATIEEGTWPVLPIFEVMQKRGDIDRAHMYNTFNMGIGMVLVADKENADKILAAVKEMGEEAYVIGKITANKDKEVEVCLK